MLYVLVSRVSLMIAIIYTCVKYCGLVDKFYSICGILLATAKSNKNMRQFGVAHEI